MMEKKWKYKEQLDEAAEHLEIGLPEAMEALFHLMMAESELRKVKTAKARDLRRRVSFLVKSIGNCAGGIRTTIGEDKALRTFDEEEHF